MTMALTALFRRTPALERFVAPAQARHSIWRVVSGLVTIGLLVIAAAMAIGLAGVLVGFDDDALARLTTSGGAGGTLTVLASFILWWGAMAAALRLFHRRGLRSLLGPEGRLAPRRFAAGLVIALGFGALSLALGAALGGAPSFSGVSPARWALGALAGALLLVVQTGAEEALFRGYLLQQMGARFRSAFAWAILPSLMFGALHWSPAAAGGALPIIFVTGAIGIIFALVTARMGDLSAAWGAHLGVNLTALLFIAPPGLLGGLALFTWPDDPATLARLAWVDVGLILLIALLGAAWTIRRDRRA